MQVEDPAPSGGAEERRLTRMEKYAASLSRASRSNERNDRLPAFGGKATQPFDLSQGRELVERQVMP